MSVRQFNFNDRERSGDVGVKSTVIDSAELFGLTKVKVTSGQCLWIYKDR